jgi:hypothetical protein
MVVDKSPEWVRAQVSEYYLSNPVGAGPHDAFCAWWLTTRWRVEPLIATAHAPGGNHDWGLDGFHIEQRVQGDPPVLHLIQAKFSESVPEVKAAVAGFVRTITQLSALLNGEGIKPVQANPTIERLHAALCRLRDEQGIPLDKLLLRFEIIHLCDQGPDILAKAVSGSREKFDASAEDELPAFEVHLRQIFPPDELVDVDGGDKPKKEAFPIRFGGGLVADSSEARFFAGFGYLSDLVSIYSLVGDALFSKNVRSYLVKAEKKGPALHMRDSLRRACVPVKGVLRDTPERFAMLHNGITISASSVSQADGKLILREPNVLNGCQTVKNAALWYADLRAKPTGGNIDTAAWERVRVPIRVLVTRDEDLVRDVTISNNRQNAIKPSAFRVNDRTQLALAERFKIKAGVFYERQEASFINVKRGDPRHVEDTYPNSFDKPIGMEELAVAIATASLRPALSVAAKPSDLFEGEQYDAVFTDDKLANLQLLVFLRNLMSVVPLALKDLKSKDTNLNGLSTGRFAFPCARILARYIVREKPSEVERFGDRVIGTFGRDHPMRERVRQLMRHHNSGLLQQLKRHWFDSSTDGWLSASDASALKLALDEHGLSQFDVFVEYRILQEAAD